MTTISIQPANTPSGRYDVNIPLPYPYHLIVPGNVDRLVALAVDRQDFWRGDPAKLIGFQRGDAQEVVLWPGDFVANPESAVGLRPVFLTAAGDMYALAVPVDSVSTYEETVR